MTVRGGKMFLTVSLELSTDKQQGGMWTVSSFSQKSDQNEDFSNWLAMGVRESFLVACFEKRIDDVTNMNHD